MPQSRQRLVSRHPSQLPMAHRPSVPQSLSLPRLPSPVQQPLHTRSGPSHGPSACPCYSPTGIRGHPPFWPAQPASKSAISGSRTSRTFRHQRTKGPSPDVPHVFGHGPPSSPPGPVPCQGSTAQPSPPGADPDPKCPKAKQNCPKANMAPLRTVVAAPPPAPDSCPGGSQAIGQ